MLTATEKRIISAGANSGKVFRLKAVRIDGGEEVGEPIFFCCGNYDLEWFLSEFGGYSGYCTRGSYEENHGYAPYGLTRRDVVEQLSKAILEQRVGIRIGRRGEEIFEKEEKQKMYSFITVYEDGTEMD